MKTPTRLWAVLYSGLTVLSIASTAPAEDLEAISARVSPDYVRTKSATGVILPENYAFGNGGYWGGPFSDRTIDKLTFSDVAHAIAKPLALQNFLPASDPKTTRLLIMVYWGTTITPIHASQSPTLRRLSEAQADLVRAYARQVHRRLGYGEEPEEWEALMAALSAEGAAETLRDKQDALNAMMLGYDSEWDRTYTGSWDTPQSLEHRDMLDELEGERYFVVLMAYDFQMLWKGKKHKLLWETRFSVSQHHAEFDHVLPALALEASKYFGRDSKGLVRDDIPAGNVELGAVRNLGTVETK
jgi:hypothetical protein